MKALCILLLILSPGCATPQGRFLVGAGSGAVLAGGTAMILSPNSESRGMNALVFGLLGALIGGGLGIITADYGKVPESKDTLKEKEKSGASENSTFVLPADSNLPEFIKERLQPVIVEELMEPDTVSEDGSLHAPHKVYRIQRQAELYANPKSQEKSP